MTISLSQERTKRADAKVPVLCDQLRQLAQGHGPDVRLPTARELCHRFGVSSPTLNEALDLLEKHGVLYRTNGHGIFVSPRLFQRWIGVLFHASLLEGTGVSSIWGHLLSLLDRKAQQREQNGSEEHHFFLIRSSSEKAIELPSEIRAMAQYHSHLGVLAVGGLTPALQEAASLGIPTISFAGYGGTSLYLDFETLVRMAAQDLIAQGCQRITLWLPAYMSAVPDMRASFEQVLRSILTASQQDMLEIPMLALPTLRTEQERGYFLARSTFDPSKDAFPGGVISLDDQMTDGALAALFALGVTPGEQIKLVTHANTGSMLLFNSIPGVRVLEFDPEILVERMFLALDLVLSGGSFPDTLSMILPHWRRDTSQYSSEE